MQKWKYLAVSAAMAASSFAPALSAHAATLDLDDKLGDVQEETGLADSNLMDTIGTLINIALSLLGVIFLLLTLYAGFLWMTAQGEEKQTTKARNIIVTAVVGYLNKYKTKKSPSQGDFLF